MSFPDFTLLPDDVVLSADEDLQAAAAGALALPDDVTPAVDPAPEPLGRTWQFDWEARRFVRRGQSPAETSGFGALEQWCLMAIHSARYAHAVFSDEFGMEDPDAPLGEFAVGEILADWQRNLVDALLVHERITAIENVDVTWDPSDGTLYLNGFDVVTDEEQRLTFGELAIERSLT